MILSLFLNVLATSVQNKDQDHTMCQQGGVLVFEIEELEELKSGPWQHFDQEVDDKTIKSDPNTVELVGAHRLASFDVN